MPYYIIDGHNVTRGMEAFARPKPDEERAALLDYLLRRRPQGRNPVTVVFDGRPGRSFDRASAGTVRVIFSEGSSADDWIKRLVDHETNPRDVVVVTADKALNRWVRGAGARVLSPREFIGQARPPVRKSVPENPADEAVTEELKTLWLKKSP